MNYITKIYISAIFLISSLMTFQIQAAPGDLDTTFGNNGVVLVSECVPLPARVRVQADGKIATAASDYIFGESFISRHNGNGTPDLFGNNLCGGGVQYLNKPVFVKDSVVGSDGSYFVTGFNGSFNSSQLALYHFDNNGILRNQTFWQGNPTSSGEKIALQTDGKLVVAGQTNGLLLLVRYNANSTLDNGFGTNGSVISSFSGEVKEVLIQTDGKIIAAGSFGIARYNPNGSLDTTFGTNGIVNTNVEGAALQTDGKIVINSRAGGFIKRYNPNGTPDISFGTNGTVGLLNELARAIVIQNNGKILTAGSMSGNFAISRYFSNGTIDTNFGTNGVAVTPINGSPNQYNSIYTLALQPDGKVIASGLIDFFYAGSGMVRYQTEPDVSESPQFDFDGDGKSDISVFRPSDRIWYLNQSTNGFSATQFGLQNDKLAPADYDGDGKTDIAVFRAGVWYWLNSSNGTVSIIQFGLTNDVPQPADFDGDGRSEIAVLRGGDNWWVYNFATRSSTHLVDYFCLDADICRAVVNDYDGDGRADYATYGSAVGDTSKWFIKTASGNYLFYSFGLYDDQPVPADYDGDSKTDLAVFRPSNGTWYIVNSTNGNTQIINWGLSTDQPVPSDYDGDGKADIAIYRNGVWWIRQSTNGIAVQQFGLADDKPVPAAYLP